MDFSRVGATKYIFMCLTGTCGLKTQGMLAYTGLGRINNGSGSGRQDMGPDKVADIAWVLTDQYTTGLIGAGQTRQRRL